MKISCEKRFPKQSQALFYDFHILHYIINTSSLNKLEQ